MKNSLKVFGIFILVIIGGIWYAKNLGSHAIDANEVVSMDVKGNTTVTYTKDKNGEKIREFVQAYNKATKINENIEKNDKIVITIKMNSGDVFTISTGKLEGVYIVNTCNNQFELRGQELRESFNKVAGEK